MLPFKYPSNQLVHHTPCLQYVRPPPKGYPFPPQKTGAFSLHSRISRRSCSFFQSQAAYFGFGVKKSRKPSLERTSIYFSPTPSVLFRGDKMSCFSATPRLSPNPFFFRFESSCQVTTVLVAKLVITRRQICKCVSNCPFSIFLTFMQAKSALCRESAMPVAESGEGRTEGSCLSPSFYKKRMKFSVVIENFALCNIDIGNNQKFVNVDFFGKTAKSAPSKIGNKSA